jgi:hypothetical protein
LNKSNVIKVNVEIEDSYLIKDALLKSIQYFNKGNDSSKIVGEAGLYKLRLSKKSGLPDIDLPVIDLNLKLSELNFTNLSVVVESDHLMIMPKKNYDPNGRLETLQSFHTLKENLIVCSGNETGKSHTTNALNIHLVDKKDKKENGCCSFFTRCCSKKK